jgi:hypothetical protein
MPGTTEMRDGILPDDTSSPRDPVLEDGGSLYVEPDENGLLVREDTLERSTGPPAHYLVSFLRL